MSLIQYNLEIQIPADNITILAFQHATIKQAKEGLHKLYNEIKELGLDPIFTESNEFSYINPDNDKTVYIHLTQSIHQSTRLIG